MARSPEVLVREFLRAWAEPSVDEIESFFAEDATWIDGPQGTRRGRRCITDDLVRQLQTVQPMTVEVVELVAAGATVMVEWRGSGVIAGRPVSTRVMAAFEIDGEGLIRRFSEYYDLSSITGQLAGN